MDPISAHEKSTLLEKMYDKDRGTAANASDSEFLSLQLLSGILNDASASASNEDKAALTAGKKIITELAREELKFTLLAAETLKTDSDIRNMMGGFNLTNALKLAPQLKAFYQQKNLEKALSKSLGSDNNIGVTEFWDTSTKKYYENVFS